jgi:hypothetical protein
MANSIIDLTGSTESQTRAFLSLLFERSLDRDYGVVEIVTIYHLNNSKRTFYNTIDALIDYSYKMSQICYADVFFGVNPRTSTRGTKDSIWFLVTFHASLTYGATPYKSHLQALNSIHRSSLKPSVIADTGSELYCYWILRRPLQIDTVGLNTVENINKGLALQLGGSADGYDITTIHRLSGTYNFQLSRRDGARKVAILRADGPIYGYEKLVKLSKNQ